jgi:hypothetical protein
MDYLQWWEEQIHRCKHGWSDGGHYATGPYYYHLNFKAINMLDTNQDTMLGHPYYSQEDMDLFLEMENAWKEREGLILITGRGFGKSYAASTIAEHKFTFYPASQVYVTASTLPFVNLLWNKINDGLNSQEDAIRHTLLTAKADYLESGYEKTINGKKKKYGYRSKLHKLAYDEKAGKTRGSRPNIHIFEEIGSWTGAAKLKDCYKKTEASWKRGGVQTCFPLLIGTGGEMETGGSEDAREMFYDPKAFNLRAVKYGDIETGHFIPAHHKLGGFYEDSGISDKVAAKAHLDAVREKKKSQQDMYLQEIQEFPFEPEEAFMTKGGNWLPVDLINNRLADLTKDPTIQKPERGYLEIVGGSTIKPGIDIVFRKDENGPFEILEHPEKFSGESKPHPDLYVGGCDSFDAVAEEMSGEKSRGALLIFKRFYSANVTGNIFVASLVQRTEDATEFYRNTVLLNLYYNSRMLYEHTKIGIAQYYITNKLSRYLSKRPKLEQDGIVKKTTATNTYGIQMPDKNKVHVIKLYGAYIREYVGQMHFEDQLIDAREFRFKSPKYDITMAAGIALLANDELYNIIIREQKKMAYKMPVYTTNSQGRKTFGIPQ